MPISQRTVPAGQCNLPMLRSESGFIGRRRMEPAGTMSDSLRSTLSVTCRMVAMAVLATGLGADTIPRELSLGQAVEIALSGHPDLDAAQAAIDARAGATVQARAAPNPVFTMQTENWRFYGDPLFSVARHLDIFAFVTLPVETAGKRVRRVGLAAADERIAQIHRQLAAWRVRQRVREAFWKVLAAESEATMLERSRNTLRQIEDYHRVRVGLGVAAEVDLIKVRVDAGRTALALSGAEMGAVRNKYSLLDAMGVPRASRDFDLVRPAPRPTRPNLELATLVEVSAERALDHRTEVLLARAHVERARSALMLERARSRPDLRPYMGYKRTMAFNTVIGGLSVALPTRDRNAGNIQEAVAEVRQREAALRALQARIRIEVASALESVKRRGEMLHSMRTGVLEDARETSRIALAAHEQEGVDLAGFLDARRAQDEIELLHSQLEFDYELSWVALEGAIGMAEPSGETHWTGSVATGIGTATAQR